MKKGKKVIIILVTIFIIALVITRIVYALSWKFNVTANKTRVKAGEEIFVYMQISDIDMGDLGINAVEAVLEYDDNIFETVERDDFTMKNNWTMTYNQEAGAQNGNFLASNITSGIKENQTIGGIRFKIREDAKPGTTYIKFKNVKSNDGRNLVSESNKTITITIYEDETVTPGQSNKVVPKPAIITGNTTVEQENLSTTELPQTGENTFIVIFAALGAIIATVFIIRYKNIHID